MCVCVWTGFGNGKYDQIMRWWSSKPESAIATVFEYVAYCYVHLHLLTWYYSPRLSYHMRWFSHPGISRLCTIISDYLCPKIPASLNASPLFLSPTAWLSLFVASSSFPVVIFLPRFPEVSSLLRLGATKPPYCVHLLHSPYPLYTHQISVATPLTFDTI